jgi:hypothetical protein
MRVSGIGHIRGYCILTPVPKSNYNFTLTFLYVAVLPLPC